MLLQGWGHGGNSSRIRFASLMTWVPCCSEVRKEHEKRRGCFRCILLHTVSCSFSTFLNPEHLWNQFWSVFIIRIPWRLAQMSRSRRCFWMCVYWVIEFVWLPNSSCDSQSAKAEAEGSEILKVPWLQDVYESMILSLCWKMLTGNEEINLIQFGHIFIWHKQRLTVLLREHCEIFHICSHALKSPGKVARDKDVPVSLVCRLIRLHLLAFASIS